MTYTVSGGTLNPTHSLFYFSQEHNPCAFDFSSYYCHCCCCSSIWTRAFTWEFDFNNYCYSSS